MAYTKQKGIYYLKNTSNGFKVYIGSSIDIRKRLTSHFSALRRGNHRCVHLQHVFNKYGEDSIQIGILEECDELNVKELREQEKYHLDEFLKIFKRSSLLNGTMNTECPLDDPEVSERQKQAVRDYWVNNHEFREAAIKRGKDRFKQLLNDKEFCKERNDRLSKLNNDIAFQNKRVKALRTICAKPVICLETGMVFESSVEAANYLRLNGNIKASQSAIGLCCRGGLKSAYKLHWKFVNNLTTSKNNDKHDETI